MSTPPRSTVTLRALKGAPLTDEKVRAIVVSTAWAIGERTGVPILSVEAKPDRVLVRLECRRLASIGFAAELRRLTEQWYARKYPDAPDPLWGESPGSTRGGADIDQNTWRSEHEDDEDWWRGGESDLGPPG